MALNTNLSDLVLIAQETKKQLNDYLESFDKKLDECQTDDDVKILLSEYQAFFTSIDADPRNGQTPNNELKDMAKDFWVEKAKIFESKFLEQQYRFFGQWLTQNGGGVSMTIECLFNPIQQCVLNANLHPRLELVKGNRNGFQTEYADPYITTIERSMDFNNKSLNEYANKKISSISLLTLRHADKMMKFAFPHSGDSHGFLGGDYEDAWVNFAKKYVQKSKDLMDDEMSDFSIAVVDAMIAHISESSRAKALKDINNHRVAYRLDNIGKDAVNQLDDVWREACRSFYEMDASIRATLEEHDLTKQPAKIVKTTLATRAFDEAAYLFSKDEPRKLIAYLNKSNEQRAANYGRHYYGEGNYEVVHVKSQRQMDIVLDYFDAINHDGPAKSKTRKTLKPS